MTSTKVSQIVTVGDSDCEVWAAVDNVKLGVMNTKLTMRPLVLCMERSMSLCFAASAWWFWMTHTVLRARGSTYVRALPESAMVGFDDYLVIIMRYVGTVAVE